MKRTIGPGERSRAFTLVELLIVIMIIAILSGLVLIAAGSVMDNAEATKVINDLRSVKAAATAYYTDFSSWPAGSPIPAPIMASLDRYMDGHSSGFARQRYDGVHVLYNPATERTYIGLGLKDKNAAEGVKKKLAGNADSCGIYEDMNGTPFSGATDLVYMSMR